MLLWQSLQSCTQNAMCSQAIHRRIELVPLEGEEVGNVAVGQNQGYMRVKLQDQDFRDLRLWQHLDNINCETRVKEKSIHWLYLYIIHEEIVIKGIFEPKSNMETRGRKLRTGTVLQGCEYFSLQMGAATLQWK